MTRLERLRQNYMACHPLDPIATIAFLAAAEQMRNPFTSADHFGNYLPSDRYWRHWYEGKGAT